MKRLSCYVVQRWHPRWYFFSWAKGREANEESSGKIMEVHWALHAQASSRVLEKLKAG